jgi:outer membrane protein assembly factor BamD (BamD/ComL family)
MKIFKLIQEPNQTTTDAAIETMVADLKGRPELANELYWTACGYEEQPNKSEQAKQMYERIIQEYPTTPEANEAVLDIRRLEIWDTLDSGEANSADALLDKFIADFKDDSRLHEAVYRTGEKHYDLAFHLENQGVDEQSKEYYKRALSVWDKIITKMPFSDIYTPQAYYAVANCFACLGDYNDAINYHKKVIADFPDFKNSYISMFMLADCYNKQASSGEMPQDKAKEQMCNIYQELLVRFPDCKLAGQVHRQLQDMCEQ